ncbi:24580_t:CDS:2 [Racocetra persica]|uniref:24580_t:CDS:1 n=1 Tax=Racocetra persica TaxID=160502 RepID=A0ACA9MD12_9GLOM|nr:24580_t:CDS:2 [Racocetra persica]
MWRDCKGPQKSEPSSILYIRRFVIILSFFILLGSVIVLVLKISKEQPNISTTFISVDNLPAPGTIKLTQVKMTLSGLLSKFMFITASASNSPKFHFEVYMKLGHMTNRNFSNKVTLQNYNLHSSEESNDRCWAVTITNYDGTDNCNNYVTQPEKIDDDNYPFTGYFYPNKSIILHKYEDEKGPYFVFLDIRIVDSNFPKIINDSTQISSFRMIAYDSENDYNIQNKQFDSASHQITPFEQSLYYMNKYTLTKPVPMSPSNTNNITLRVSPSSIIVREEKEQRLWGVVHSGCCGLRKFKEKTKDEIDKDLEQVIKIYKNNSNNQDFQASNQDLPESGQDYQDLRLITTRIEELERFRCFIEMNVIKTKPWKG